MPRHTMAHRRRNAMLARQGYGGSEAAGDLYIPDFLPTVDPKPLAEHRVLGNALPFLMAPLDVLAETTAELGAQIPKIARGLVGQHIPGQDPYRFGDIEAPTLFQRGGGFTEAFEQYQERPMWQQVLLDMFAPTPFAAVGTGLSALRAPKTAAGLIRGGLRGLGRSRLGRTTGAGVPMPELPQHRLPYQTEMRGMPGWETAREIADPNSAARIQRIGETPSERTDRLMAQFYRDRGLALPEGSRAPAPELAPRGPLPPSPLEKGVARPSIPAPGAPKPPAGPPKGGRTKPKTATPRLDVGGSKQIGEKQDMTLTKTKGKGDTDPDAESWEDYRTRREEEQYQDVLDDIDSLEQQMGERVDELESLSGYRDVADLADDVDFMRGDVPADAANPRLNPVAHRRMIDNVLDEIEDIEYNIGHIDADPASYVDPYEWVEEFGTSNYRLEAPDGRRWDIHVQAEADDPTQLHINFPRRDTPTSFPGGAQFSRSETIDMAIELAKEFPDATLATGGRATTGITGRSGNPFSKVPLDKIREHYPYEFQ